VFRDAGVQLFQGLFYERPNLVAGQALPVGHGAALGALHELQSKGADFDALEEIVRRDVALSSRLLRHVNSAFFALPRTVGSIREALTLLGTRAVRQWAVALVLSGLEHRPHALLSTALVRARTCELVLAPYDKESAGHGFTAGLFSLLDAVLGAPMDEILAELPLAPEVEAAITAHEGVAGKALAKTIAFERGDFDAPALAGHARNALTIAYSDAVQWADALL
jgi:EAL and modified HD-GYP domain-containing signal transduction protein